ncbi:MAG TPA: hypothetical protein VIC25_03880 [Caulobacteraceae bacterium]|jgi:hypothetical protein
MADKSTSAARRSRKPAPKPAVAENPSAAAREQRLDRVLEATFPASDPPPVDPGAN